jgi:hypothetical protein
MRYNEIDSFRSDMDKNIAFLQTEIDVLPEKDQRFCQNLIDFYTTKEYLSNVQISYLVTFMDKIKEYYE